MSQTNRATNEDSDPDPDSSSNASRLSSSGATTCESSSSTSYGSTSTGSNCNTRLCNEPNVGSAGDPGSSGHIRRDASSMKTHSDRQAETGKGTLNATDESSRQKRDGVIQRSQSTMGRKCDNTRARTSRTTSQNSPRLDVKAEEVIDRLNPHSSDQLPSTSHLNCPSIHATNQSAPSARPATTDTNNNRNLNQIPRVECTSGIRRNNFSKSASGGRLSNKNDVRSNVCDCLSQDCCEKEHSNRRHFIENYYNSRTRLPSATAMSSLNISSPLNRLSECDAITKRLLSSPIRAGNFTENPTSKTQAGEVDKSRRASLGADTMTEQVSLYSSNQFNSLELTYRNGPDNSAKDNQQACDPSVEDKTLTRDYNSKLKQQQGRSLSVCQEEPFKTRIKVNSFKHSSNLNRAVSLAYESGASKRLTIIPLFGCDLKALEQFMRLGLILPPSIDSSVEHILAHGINSIGIFRKSGVKSRILTLRQRIEANQGVSLEEINKDNQFSIYDIADLVKMWFRELKPMPILTKELIVMISDHLRSSGSIDKHVTTSENTQGDRPTEGLESRRHDRARQTSSTLKQQISSTISPTHKALFSKAMNLLASISSKSETNQMTSQNLAICLTPSLCATGPDQNSIIVAQRALQYCIDNYRILF